MAVQSTFTQATTATTRFPPAVSDYFKFDELLSSEEQALRLRVRQVMEKHVAPIAAEVSILIAKTSLNRVYCSLPGDGMVCNLSCKESGWVDT